MQCLTKDYWAIWCDARTCLLAVSLDKLIGPYFLPELQDNLPTVKSEQRDPSLALTWLDGSGSPLFQTCLLAGHASQ